MSLTLRRVVGILFVVWSGLNFLYQELVSYPQCGAKHSSAFARESSQLLGDWYGARYNLASVTWAFLALLYYTEVIISGGVANSNFCLLIVICF